MLSLELISSGDEGSLQVQEHHLLRYAREVGGLVFTSMQTKESAENPRSRTVIRTVISIEDANSSLHR